MTKNTEATSRGKEVLAKMRGSTTRMTRRFRWVAILGLVGALASGWGSAAQAANVWTATGSMATGRYFHSATLLPNGRVLVAGGWTGSAYTPSAELYDPSAGTWTAAGTLTAARAYHTATLLPNGRVLVAGGYTNSGPATSAELYDPSTGTWTATGAMATGRFVHAAALLANGKVLVAGGHNGSAHTAWAELYDPAAGTWTTTGAMTTARSHNTATLLANGKVLVAGGPGPANSTELYDPSTGTWTATGSMTIGRHLIHTATLLANGKVLVAGGDVGSGITAYADLYEPSTGTWTATGPMTRGRAAHTATLLPSGKVLAAGGNTDLGVFAASAEMYDPSSGIWTATGTMTVDRYKHTATLLPSGRVLVAGGNTNAGTTNSAELYEPADTNSPPTANAAGPYSVQEAGSVQLMGSGSDPDTGQTLSYAWDLDNNGTFETAGQTPTFSATSLDGPATRTVVLRVCDSGTPSLCATASTTANVSNVAPTPNSGGPYTVPEGGSVGLFGSGSDVPADTLTYAWDLDSNGSFESPGQNVTFSVATLDGPSTRTVVLQACDDDAGCGTASATVNVTNVPPTITSVTNNGPINEGGSATIAVTATDPAGPADTLVLRGDCNNDGTFETIPIEMVQLNLVSTAPITCIFPDNGTFRVNVQVTDGDGGAATGGTTVLGNNLPPTANAGGPYTVPEGGSVGLSGSGSDVPADTLTYAWDLDNDGTYETPGQNVTFSAAGLDGPSLRPVVLQVCDDDGACATSSATVNVANIPPTITSVTDNGPVNEGSSVTIMVSATDPAGAADTLVLRGDCNNDGSFETVPIEMVQLVLVSSAPITCTFPDNGTFRVNVQVTDGDGGTATGGTFVSVLNVAPMVVFTAQTPVNQGSPFSLSLTNPLDPSSVDTAAGFAYAFDCGDGAGYGPSSGSNTASCPTTDSGTRSVRGKIADKDGGTNEHAASVAVLDVTPPTITGAPTTGINANGWFNTPVTIHWACADNPGGSGLASCPADTLVSTEGAHQQVRGTATDNAGLSSFFDVFVDIDLTAPSITGAPTTSPNASGWFTGPVTIRSTCTDALSGIASCPADTLVSTEWAHQQARGTATDNAGLGSFFHVFVDIDMTAPSITGTPTTSPNAGGWFTGPVTIRWTCTDALSGIASCPGETAVSTEGAHQQVRGTATDNAGLSSFFDVFVDVDMTAPAITGAPTTSPNASGWFTGPVAIHWTCIDGGSGLASCPPDTTVSTEGAHQQVRGTATDNAGLSSFFDVFVDIDMAAPVTTATPNPAPDANGWNSTNVAVALACADNVSGCARTEYNLDGTGYVPYTAAIDLTADGVHTLLYRSTDRAANAEVARTLMVRIDKHVDTTPPEAYNQFDPVTKNVLVFARDAGSGVPAGPIAPTSVTPTRWGDDRDEDDGDRGNAELRTYRVTDLAGNTLTLVEKVKREGHEIKVHVVSLQYNGGPVITPPRNTKRFEWSLNRDGSLKELEQKLEVGQGRDKQAVEAKFDGKKNETEIKRERSERKLTRPGLALLRLATANGSLVIEY